MTDLEARYELFGDPSDTLVAESVWAFIQDNGTAPLWEEAKTDLCQWKHITKAEAQERIHEAIRTGDVIPRLDDTQQWVLDLPEPVSDRIHRRYLDNSLRRKENAE